MTANGQLRQWNKCGSCNRFWKDEFFSFFGVFTVASNELGGVDNCNVCVHIMQFWSVI